MKYYTKEWYELMQCQGNYFRKIPDAVYSDADIKGLYEKKLKREIASDRKIYNQEPFEEEFGNRPPFDPAETISWFEEGYRMEIDTCRYNLPAWMVESVDHRLIALGYLPETAYNRYKKEVQEREKRWKAMNKAAEKVLCLEKMLPDRLKKALCLHDARLLSLQKQGKKLVMIVAKDGGWSVEGGETPYRRVVFENAEILEREKGLRTRKYMDNGIYSSDVSFLYHELYEKDGIYEAHMMFWRFGGLMYLTVKCSDIIYTDNI